MATIGVGGVGGHGWEGEAACGLKGVIWMLLMFFPSCRASGLTVEVTVARWKLRELLRLLLKAGSTCYTSFGVPFILETACLVRTPANSR